MWLLTGKLRVQKVFVGSVFNQREAVFFLRNIFIFPSLCEVHPLYNVWSLIVYVLLNVLSYSKYKGQIAGKETQWNTSNFGELEKRDKFRQIFNHYQVDELSYTKEE